MSDYEAALNAYQQAQQNLEYADAEHVDAAIYQLLAAEEQLCAVLRDLKRAN